MELEQQRCKLEEEQKAAAELEVARMQIDADRRMWELEQQRRYAFTTVFTTASLLLPASWTSRRCNSMPPSRMCELEQQRRYASI